MQGIDWAHWKRFPLTPNQPKKPDFCNFLMVLGWFGIRGKRFQDFSMRAIDSSHRKISIGLLKFFWRKFGRKIAKIHFFSHPVPFYLLSQKCLWITLNLCFQTYQDISQKYQDISWYFWKKKLFFRKIFNWGKGYIDQNDIKA